MLHAFHAKKEEGVDTWCNSAVRIERKFGRPFELDDEIADGLKIIIFSLSRFPCLKVFDTYCRSYVWFIVESLCVLLLVNRLT